MVFVLLISSTVVYGKESAVPQLKEAELQALQKRIRALRSDLGNARDRYGVLQQELAKVERALGRVSSGLRTLKRERREHQRQLKVFAKERVAQQKALGQQRELLKQQIRARYATGRQEYVKFLFNQQDPARFGRANQYYAYLNQARAQRIEEVERAWQELKRTEEAIAETTVKLDAVIAQEKDKQVQLKQVFSERGVVVAKLKGEITDNEQALDRLLTDEKQLQNLLKGLQELLIDIPDDIEQTRSFAQLKGRLLAPVAGRVKKRYGALRKGGRLKWQGMLYAAQEGEDVKAISHGRVVFSDWLRGFGLLTIIDHGEGYMSLYGYNQSLYKDVGEWVAAGEVIAAVGSSGGQQHAGLYFEIRRKGKPVNPLRWLKKRRG